jgi:flagellar biosynthesis protein FlhB
MSEDSEDDSDKIYEATPQKLQKAREKGEIAKSADLTVAAGYAGWILAAIVFGAKSVIGFGSGLMVLLSQPDRLSPLIFDGPASGPIGGILAGSAAVLAPWYFVPVTAVLLSVLAQRGFVVAPSKVQPKGSRVSILANAKNKFGRSGLFEFAKSLVKLVIYSTVLGFFLRAKIPDMVAAVGSDSGTVVSLMVRLSVEFFVVVLLVATALGFVDAIWQHNEYLRKNRMSRKEITDETKDSEGDPHFKQKRRIRGQEIARSQMMKEVPRSDVVIVNPTHFAVALTWSKEKGAAPVCVAKGVDEMALAIRKFAAEAGVPIHHDPPCARALHASVDIGQEIAHEHFRAVAAAIRFAENMRLRARGQVW